MTHRPPRYSATYGTWGTRQHVRKSLSAANQRLHRRLGTSQDFFNRQVDVYRRVDYVLRRPL